MRRGLLFAVLAVAVVAAVPGEGEAFGRRRAARCPCPPAPPPCPPVVYHLPPAVGPAPVAVAESAEVPAEVTIKGRRYRLVAEAGPADYRPDAEETAPEVVPEAAPKTAIPAADRFTGTSRRAAKTTVFAGPVEEFDTLGALLDSLPANDLMRAKGISNAPGSARVAEERRNVRVTAFIYAFKKEPDKDYHVILGDAPGTPGGRFLNVEVSGIPAAGTAENRARLWAVRNEFKSAFGLGGSGPNKYFKPVPPVPVRVAGSLFWDADHESPPFVGPSSHKPLTPWEVHPVSEIEFLAE